MTLKETIADQLQALLDELEEDEGDLSAEDIKSLVKDRVQEVLDLVTED